jgi:hypothetical protein
MLTRIGYEVDNETKVSRRCLKMRRKETKTAGIFQFRIESMCLHLSDKESLQFLRDRGFIVSRAELYRLKNEVKESTNELLNL